MKKRPRNYFKVFDVLEVLTIYFLQLNIDEMFHLLFSRNSVIFGIYSVIIKKPFKSVIEHLASKAQNGEHLPVEIVHSLVYHADVLLPLYPFLSYRVPYSFLTEVAAGGPRRGGLAGGLCFGCREKADKPR